MKADIHPKLFLTKVHCACGNEFETLSTQGEQRLEICGACHPYYTGKKRAISAAGRVQKFQDKYAGVDVGATPAPSRKKTAAAEKVAKKTKKR